MSTNLASMEEVSWDDVRLRVKEVAPDIFEAVERISFDSSYKLYKICYPYGSMIIGQQGLFQVPYGHKLLPVNDSKIDPKIKKLFGYNQLNIPMGLLINGVVHLFSCENTNKSETEFLYGKGNMLATRGALDESLSYQAWQNWRMSIGARTPAMLPSISDASSFQKLKKHFNLKSLKPESQKDHWQLFSEIANHKNFSSLWRVEFLAFSYKWLEPRKDDAWRLFKLALMERSWKSTQYARHVGAVSKLWESFASGKRDKKVSPFVLNMVRHIVEASLGQAVCHTPADGRDISGPFDALSQVFLDVYALKKYAPIIMEPYVFNPQDNRPGYVSLQMFNMHGINLVDRNEESLISEAREIKDELNRFLDKVSNNSLGVSGTPFSTLTDFDYRFYHADYDRYGEMLSSENIFEGDAAVGRWLSYPNNNAIPYRNAFLRSCVRFEKRK